MHSGASAGHPGAAVMQGRPTPDSVAPGAASGGGLPPSPQDITAIIEPARIEPTRRACVSPA
jgi:hypothetical protein